MAKNLIALYAHLDPETIPAHVIHKRIHSRAYRHEKVRLKGMGHSETSTKEAGSNFANSKAAAWAEEKA